MTASLVINNGPARNASAIFSYLWTDALKVLYPFAQKQRAKLASVAAATSLNMSFSYELRDLILFCRSIRSIVGLISTVSLDENCLEMAFSATTPLARGLSQHALEGSCQGGLIGEATLGRKFGERQP
jgi:hypothetical protein